MSNDVFNEPVLIEMPNVVIRSYRPILTEEERKKRMKAIHDAAADLLKDVERKKANGKKK